FSSANFFAVYHSKAYKELLIWEKMFEDESRTKEKDTIKIYHKNRNISTEYSYRLAE
ncbi:8185_t:CDS:1, partial [Ambispora gerdemannii]